MFLFPKSLKTTQEQRTMSKNPYRNMDLSPSKERAHNLCN